MFNPHLCQQFFNPGFLKNQQGTLSLGNSNLHCTFKIILCLWQDSYKGVAYELTLDESIMHHITIINAMAED